jgi:hypothetical protein
MPVHVNTEATARTMRIAIERAGLECALAAARFAANRQGGGAALLGDIAAKERRLRELDGGRLRRATRALVGRR